MKTSEIRPALRRRWLATVLVVVLAIVIAVVVHGQLGSVPTGESTTQILVDSPSSSLVNVNVNSAGLTAQASVLAQAMTSQVVLEDIAKSARVPVGSVSAQGPFNGAGEVLDIPTPSEARSNQLLSVKSSYHVAFVAQPDVPIITVTVTGPNPQAAGRVADAVLPGTRAWLSTIAASSTLPKTRQLTLRQLGDAQAGAVNSRSAEIAAAIAAIAIIILGLLAVLLVDRRLQERSELQRRRIALGGSEPALASDVEQRVRGGLHSGSRHWEPGIPERDALTSFDESSAAPSEKAQTVERGEGELVAAGARSATNGARSATNGARSAANGARSAANGAPRVNKPRPTNKSHSSAAAKRGNAR